MTRPVRGLNHASPVRGTQPRRVRENALALGTPVGPWNSADYYGNGWISPGYLHGGKCDAQHREEPLAGEGKAAQDQECDTAGDARHAQALAEGVTSGHGEESRDGGERIDDHEKRAKREHPVFSRSHAVIAFEFA